LSSGETNISFTLTTGVNNVNWDAVSSDSGTKVLPTAGVTWPGILLLVTGMSALLTGGKMIRVEKNKIIFKNIWTVPKTSPDSERVKAFFAEKGNVFVDDWKEADSVIINSCVIRESAENRVYGLIDKIRNPNPPPQSSARRRIILTGCLVPIAKIKLKGVDEMFAD